MAHILLKTSIPFAADAWHVGRFSLLRRHLESLGHVVEARDRMANDAGHDRDLLALPAAEVDQLWLFAVEAGAGLTPADCAAINAFRDRGGGCLLTRDHQDLGASLLRLGELGAAHHFQSANREPDSARHCRDDSATATVSWPNYHSGRNGDWQEIRVLEPRHSLLVDGAHGARPIRFLPAHPHEGVVGVPSESAAPARVIAAGTSKHTRRTFNLAVAFERGPEGQGRCVAQSTFHHFADYNWEPALGCPSFVGEAPGDGMRANPDAMSDTLAYMRNLAAWL